MAKMVGQHRWTFVLPLVAWVLLALKLTHVVDPANALVVLAAAAALLGTVFAAVHHAEVVALRVGEPFGSIVLAVAVTVIEVALIVSVMISAPDGGAEVARDTVFAAVMIVLNGIVGLCLLVGGVRYHEQAFKTTGAAAGLGVIGTLATLALILPNYTLAVPGPVYSAAQLAFVGLISLLLYGQYLVFQTVTHRDYFLDSDVVGTPVARPPLQQLVLSLIALVAALLAVVLLAKTLSPVVERSVQQAGLPDAFVGVVIAAVVLLPEGLSAFAAARANRLQNALNLSLGSALASIGLTIPAVAAVSLIIDKPLHLGLAAEHIVLLVLTLFIGTLTLGTGRTTTLQGGVHLVIFGAFLVIAAIP